MRHACSLATLVLLASAVGCQKSELVVDIARSGAMESLVEVVITTPPTSSEGITSQVLETNKRSHDRLAIQSKIPIRVRVIVEPALRPTTDTPTPPMPATQPAVPGRRAEP